MPGLKVVKKKSFKLIKFWTVAFNCLFIQLNIIKICAPVNAA